MTTPNPLENLSTGGAAVSKVTLPIAGLHVDIYGLSELAPAAAHVSCLWLHHPRLQKKEGMAPTANAALQAWHQTPGAATRGLIAVAFDVRNHGTRRIHDLGNQAWRSGNPTHAQDMLGIIFGTVVDTGLLMDMLEGYLFGNGGGPGPASGPAGSGQKIDQHLALGVSLGGHSVWQTLFAEPRLSAGVAVIGCPDLMALLADRARLSKLATYKADGGFLGSTDFPPALVAACEKYDPKGVLFGTGAVAPPQPSDADQARLRPLLDARVRGKKLQVLSGGLDKLVPYAKAEPFLTFLKSATETWYKDGGVSVEDIVYPEVAHEFSAGMMKDAVRFIVNVVSEADQGKVLSPRI
jgi:hypothetical protein